MTRTFHVEITFNRTIEVKLNDCDYSEDEDIEDVAQEVALESAWRSECTIDEDYTVETVKEIASESPTEKPILEADF
jgi:hypothetical protein